MAEAGVKDFEASLLFAVMMPPDTAEIVTRINRDIVEFMAEPEVKRALAGQAIIATEHARRVARPDATRSSFGAASRRRPASSRNHSKPPADLNPR